MGMLYSFSNQIQTTMQINDLQANQQKLQRYQLELTNSAASLGQQEEYWKQFYNNGGSRDPNVVQNLQMIQMQKQMTQRNEKNTQIQLSTIQVQLTALQDMEKSLKKTTEESEKRIFSTEG